MPEIKLDEFATECIRQGLYFGINAHYTVALAMLRAKNGALSNEVVNDAVGPYMIKQDLWDAGRVANDLEIFLQKDQIKGWRFQCLFAALNASRSRNCSGRRLRFQAAQGRGRPSRVRRMASMARIDLRRAVSTTDRISA